jgi:hypothetical protein
MINPHNIMDILTNLISERLTLSSTPANTRRDEEVAAMLFENVESILNCTSYSFENEDTLDFDSNIKLINEETATDDNDDLPSDDNDDLPSDDNDDDYNNEREKEDITQDQFSLEYMINAVEFYDEKNEKTGKRKHTFSNVQRHFKE